MFRTLLRAGLAAAKFADPANQIDLWTDRFADSWRHIGLAEPQATFAALACAGALGRTRDVGACLFVALQRAGSCDAGAIRSALGTFVPAGWLEDAARLDAAFDGYVDPVEIAALAIGLIRDLDEAELAAVVARHAGHAPDAAWADGVAACGRWLSSHADLFTSAATYVCSVAATIDTAECLSVAGLGDSALKFLRLQEALEEMDEELRL
jgi:hypothetical protein